MTTIDVARLPRRALVDTGVVIRALGDRTDDPRFPQCVEIWAAMLASKRMMMIATPTISEITRFNPSQKIPRHQFIEVVSFDTLAAELLGQKLPMTVLDQAIASTKLSRHYIKYDALIVSCAARHKAEVIISLDGDHTGLAKHVGLESRRPDFYYSVQAAFKGFVPPQP